MIKAIIIDDEMHCRKTLGILLREYCPDVEVIDQCSNGIAGTEAIKRLKGASRNIIEAEINWIYALAFVCRSLRAKVNLVGADELTSLKFLAVRIFVEKRIDLKIAIFRELKHIHRVGKVVIGNSGTGSLPVTR